MLAVMGARGAVRALIIVFIVLIRLNGQSFDVASIRPHDSANRTFIVHMPNGGQFSAEGAPLKLFVMLAYGAQESQIVDSPGWVDAEKWDIDAKSENRQHSSEETKLMLQHLLEDRFSLKIHREIRQRPVY